MPIGASLPGTLVRLAAPGAGATGTLDAVGYADNPALGTLSVDRTLFKAFYSRVRKTRPDITLNGALMANLVDTVEIDESLDDPIRYLTFTLSDKRSAFFDPDSLSNGSFPVEADFWAGPPGFILKWQAFIGSTLTSQNTMPYRPRGVFKALSPAALWAASNGCLNIPALSGLTRGQVIAAFAATAGVVISNGASLGGGKVTKPIDLSGETPFQLIQEMGEIEGWFARATIDGTGLEVISEDTILDGTPIFAFDESNYFDIPEATPGSQTGSSSSGSATAAGVNDWILSTTQLVLGSTSTSDPSEYNPIYTKVSTPGLIGGLPSLTITEITTQAGAEIKRIVTQEATISIPGESVLPPGLNITSIVQTDTEWEPYSFIDQDGVGHDVPSTQLNKRTTTTTLLMGVPCANGVGFAWVGGGRFLNPFATLDVAEIIVETYTWDPVTCFQTSSLVVKSQYYAPLLAGGAWTYPDGSVRINAVYSFQEISRDVGSWADLTGTAPPSATQTVTHSQWYVPDASTQTEIYSGYSTTTNQYTGNNSNTSFNQSTSTQTITGDTTSSASPTQTGSVPAPPTGSSSIPQFQQQVITWEFDASAASGYPKTTSSPGALPLAENTNDLISIARHRIRLAYSDQLAISHRCVPFLRVGDHVSVTNHRRGLVNVDAYVWSIKRTADVTNAAMHQVTTVNIPPTWV